MNRATSDAGEALDISLEAGEGCERSLTITVPEARVRAVRAEERRRLGDRLKLKGFRKGKVPDHVVEQRFGDTVDQRVVQTLIDETFREAVRAKELQPVGEPRVEDVRFEREGPFRFRVELEVRPEVSLARTGGFRVPREVESTTDEEIETLLERIREEHGDWERVERKPEPGDRVSVRIAPLAGDGGGAGEPKAYRFVLGSGEALPAVEEAIGTLAPGGSDDFPIDFPAEEESGGPVRRVLRIELDEVEARRLPPLDDDLAARVGDFASVEELRSAIREDVRRHHEEEAERRVRAALLESVIDANPFPVPRAMVDAAVDRMIGAEPDADPGELERAREALRPHAERQVRESLVLDRIIESEGLQPTEAELEERIRRMAERREVPPAEVRRRLAREGGLQALGRHLAVEKAFEYLRSRSEVG